MDPPVIKPPEWPAPNAELEAAIGRFIIAWNVLEREIDRSIHDIVRLQRSLAMSLTANLAIKGKLDLFHALAYSLHAYGPGRVAAFDQELIDTIDRLVADTGNATGEDRNLIVHGQPTYFHDPTEGRREAWAKISARKGGLKGTIWFMSAESVDERTASVRSLIERWNGARKLMARELYELIMWERTEGPMEEE